MLMSSNRRVFPSHILADAECGSSSPIVELYRRRVLPIRTRKIPLLGRKCPARIVETLLGYEVKASYKRIHCPDMITARYLKIFTELGCRSIRLPYDPTVTAAVVPELEDSIDRIAGEIDRLYPDNRRIRLYAARKVYRCLREQLREAGRLHAQAEFLKSATPPPAANA